MAVVQRELIQGYLPSHHVRKALDDAVFVEVALAVVEVAVDVVDEGDEDANQSTG